MDFVCLYFVENIPVWRIKTRSKLRAPVNVYLIGVQADADNTFFDCASALVYHGTIN